MPIVTTPDAPDALGGPGGADQEPTFAGLSERLRLDLAEAFLDDSDPTRFRDAVAELAKVARSGKSSRARVRAANALLTHATRVAAMGLDKGATVNVGGPTVVLDFDPIRRAAMSAALDPEARAAALTLTQALARGLPGGETRPVRVVDVKPETNGHAGNGNGNGHVNGNGRG